MYVLLVFAAAVVPVFFDLDEPRACCILQLSSVRAKFCHILLRKKLTETIMEMING